MEYALKDRVFVVLPLTPRFVEIRVKITNVYFSTNKYNIKNMKDGNYRWKIKNIMR